MTSLIKYEAACRALQEAVAVDEVKDLRDKADAMRIYAMQAKNKTLEVDAAEIRIRAERRLGEMISAQKETVGLNTGAKGIGKSAVPSEDRTPKLADVGISKNLSSRAQKLAAVPEAEFEAEVGEWRDRVQAEGARVATRLEKAGERVLAEQPEPEDDGPSASEQVFFEEKEKADREAYDALVEIALSDDKVAGLTTLVATQAQEIGRLNAEIRVVKEARDGHMNGKNEAIRMVKSLQRKLSEKERAAA
jgi:hypothetical protein